MTGRQCLTLYNTLTRRKEAFSSIDADNVRMYVCGPTVYDYAHIGNARPVIVFDVLFRLLRHVYGAEHVTYVRNITDVDDKITARARRDYPGVPLNQAIHDVTQTTEKQYKHDMSALGCLDPSVEPRATENIGEMIAMIDGLVKGGHAYAKDGHVLFDVRSFISDGELEYGKLARRSLDDMIAGARVEVAPYKRDPMDFVLWKPSTDDEPGWESPWGRGRPGWHIECSAMSARYLGETFDIHGGGIDLSFPHHENELAQSRCANHTEIMAQVWMHNGFLNVEGEKMSKSLGNFITVHELLETDTFGGRTWPGDVLRLAVLMTNYREPIDFSIARLNEAEAMLQKWKTRILEGGLKFDGSTAAVEAGAGPCSKLIAALANDLNMPGALAELHRHAREEGLHHAQRLYGSLQLLGLADEASMKAFVAAEAEAMEDVDQTGVATRIDERLKAIANKDFATADAIREDLLTQNVQLMDYKDPETGERRTKWEIRK